MTGSASNITTQWTFRDGRDYLLSLTNTETPNTVSFWISDTITGEEWTGCYDENCIEVLTKRTGCYKNFQTFLLMIKSAIFKKSKSVLLELLNLQDLAAISIHRQTTTSNEGGHATPLNVELYNSEVTLNAGNPHPQHSSANPRNVPSTDTNTSKQNGITGSSNKPQSPLNKRKYLIVSYIGEFDKVHYPLPLNYSNPPDLNVMQNNIMKLKAEVTSLKSTKKELEDNLEAIKLSGWMSQHSHENNDDVKSPSNIIPQPQSSDDSNSTEVRNQQVLISKNSNHQQTETKNNCIEGPNVDDVISTGFRKLTPIVTPTCPECGKTIGRLLEKVRDLESETALEREEYSQCLEKLNNENNFLRHKAEASKKHEVELLNQIQTLEAKVEMMENLEKERKLQAVKDARKNRFPRSRLDLFYNNNNQFEDGKPVRKAPSKSSSKFHETMPRESGSNIGRKDSQINQRSRSNSNSTASYSSGSPHTKQNIFRRSRSQDNQWKSRSFSSTKDDDFISRMQKSRSGSLSPGKIFDPTAYIKEKKMKQSRIANLRMQKIEARIRTTSRESIRSTTPSPSRLPKHFTRTTLSPLKFPSNRSASGEITSPSKPLVRTKLDNIRKSSPNRTNFKLFEDRIERIGRDKARPSSAESYRRKVLPTTSRYHYKCQWPETEKYSHGCRAENATNFKTKPCTLDIRKSMNAPTFASELKNRILRVPAKKPVVIGQKVSTTVNKAINTSFIGDELESLVAPNQSSALNIDEVFAMGQNDKKDIIVLQEKLSALNAFLEACKQNSN